MACEYSSYVRLTYWSVCLLGAADQKWGCRQQGCLIFEQGDFSLCSTLNYSPFSPGSDTAYCSWDALDQKRAWRSASHREASHRAIPSIWSHLCVLSMGSLAWGAWGRRLICRLLSDLSVAVRRMDCMRRIGSRLCNLVKVLSSPDVQGTRDCGRGDCCPNGCPHLDYRRVSWLRAFPRWDQHSPVLLDTVTINTSQTCFFMYNLVCLSSVTQPLL